MPEPLHITEAEKAAYRSIYAPTATDDQWSLFINECVRRALVPGVHVIFQLRSASEYDADLKRMVFTKKVTLITTINALRLIADRSGKYEGHGPFVYYYNNEDGGVEETKIPRGKIPHAVSVEGFRTGWRVPLFATARYDAYVQKYGEDGAKKPTQMWATRGEEQLAKCCEAMMLRTVAPEECAGLLISEELGNDGIVDKEDNTPITPAVIPAPLTVPSVNQGTGSTEALVAHSSFLPAVLVEAPKMEDYAHIVTLPVPCAVVPDPPKLAVPITPGEFQAEDGSPFPPAQPAPVTPVATVAAADQDKPATSKEYDAFLARAAKLVRDKLPKGGMKDQEASNGVKNYLLKQTGKTGLKQISATAFEKLLKAVEDATPEDAVAAVRAGSK
jgi:hypothetical protein